MNYFKSFVKGSDEAQPSGAETVARLCDRVASATLLEDRRDAVRALKSLSRKFRFEVGTQAMMHVTNVLETDSNDDEIIAYSLDTLCNLMSTESDMDDESVPQPELTLTFVENFISEERNVILVLDLIERYDFNVRLSSVRLLTSLLRSQTGKIQQIVLTKPMGISHLIDLLTDSREVIRNDALLVLIELTRGNSNIQKIVAFENGFEIILDIIRAEGLSDGGVVVEDCLLLLMHLLKRNTSNQQFFKEGSLIQRLTPFFEIDSESVWSAQKVANLHLMIKVIRTLVSPSNPSNVTASCQLVMQQCGLLQRLCNMLMATGVPADILTETINTLSEVIRGCTANQVMFESVCAPCDPPRPAIVVLLMSMVNDKQPFELRCAVLYCFQCFLHGNPGGQAKIVSTLLPSSLEPQQISAGQLLCGGLFAASDPLSNWCSAVALSHALHDNIEMKQQLLRVQLATSVGNPPVSLLQQITNIVRQSTSLQGRMGLLILLCSWLSGCPLAVSYFLHDAAAVPFLLSQVAEHGNELDHLLHGVCALLLGICIVDNDGSVPQCTKESLIELIVARVGIERFCDTLACVTKHDLYSKAFQRSQPVADAASNMLFDHKFTKLFKSSEDNVVKMVSNLEDVKKEEESKAAIKAHDSIVKEYQTLIRNQDSELTELRARVENLETDLTQANGQLEERTTQVQQLKDQYNVLKVTRGSSSSDTTAGDSAEVLSSLTVQIEELKQENAEKASQLAEKENIIQQLRNDLNGLEIRALQLSSSDERQQNDNQVSQDNTNVPDDSISAANQTNMPDDSRLQEHRLAQLSNEVDTLRAQLLAKDDELRAVMEERTHNSQNTTDDVYDALVAEKTSMQTKISDLEARLAATDVENERLKSEIAAFSSEASSHRQEVESLRGQVQNAQARAEELKKQADDVKREQEDLLILLSDQDSKIENYKSQLKDLGGKIRSPSSAQTPASTHDNDDLAAMMKKRRVMKRYKNWRNQNVQSPPSPTSDCGTGSSGLIVRHVASRLIENKAPPRTVAEDVIVSPISHRDQIPAWLRMVSEDDEDEPEDAQDGLENDTGNPTCGSGNQDADGSMNGLKNGTLE